MVVRANSAVNMYKDMQTNNKPAQRVVATPKEYKPKATSKAAGVYDSDGKLVSNKDLLPKHTWRG